MLSGMKVVRRIPAIAATRIAARRTAVTRKTTSFHTSTSLAAIKPFILTDIGEGTTEVEIIQWFVKPGDRVEEWQKLCEVQSDKTAAEISSRYAGVIRKLHYKQEDKVEVGKALCDIDVPDDIEANSVATPEPQQSGSAYSPQQPQKTVPVGEEKNASQQPETGQLPEAQGFHYGDARKAVLATPAVRALLKEYKLHPQDVNGTGKDGRVLKEDVLAHISSHNHTPLASRSNPSLESEKHISLTPVQSQMFKVMTRSLSIPHFSYADEIDTTDLSALRQRLNAASLSEEKLSQLPFFVKALSLALHDFPLLNARIEMPKSEKDPPKLVLRRNHNIGIAIDSPSGLVVPVVKDVEALSIPEIAAEIRRLRSLALASKLTMDDISGGTITVSNIGSIGGTYVSPIIASAAQVAILGLGKAKRVPVFVEGKNGKTKIEAREICCLSWSADHRVVDGATVAMCGEKVRRYIENAGMMVTAMR